MNGLRENSGTLTPEDRWEISDLLATIAFAADSRDMSLLDLVFVPEATGNFGPAGTREGLEEIKAGMMRVLEPLDATQHALSTSLVTPTETGAHARTYWSAQHVLNGMADGDQFVVSGTYDDDLVRSANGNWRLTYRKILVTWTDGNPSVLGLTDFS